MKPRILSLSTVYPKPTDPRLGLFVRSRLQALSRHCEIKVISPVSAVDYVSLRQNRSMLRRPPAGWQPDGDLEVMYPRWFYPPGGGVVNGVLLGLQLARIVDRTRRSYPFNLLDAHFGYPEGVAAAALARRFACPYMVTLRGNETFHGLHRWRRKAMRSALLRANRVITVSRQLAEFAMSLGVPAERVHVVGNGINTDRFVFRDRHHCRQKHGVPAGVPLILSVGYLIERKGHHRIVSALSSLPDDVRLWIVGEAGREGFYEARIRTIINATGVGDRVRFLGAVPQKELAELMAAADVFCLASSREGWPNVVHEALGCGTPVVATDVGAVRDLLPSERYGLIVELENQKALADALREALARDWNREEISSWARSRSWATVAGEVFEIIQSILDRTPRGTSTL